MDVVDTGGPVTVPVGKETLGRVFNLLGEPIDDRGPVDDRGAPADPPRAARRSPTCRPRPRCSRPASRSSTCSRPSVRGGKAGLFGGAGLGKTVLIQELIARIAQRARRLLGVRRRRRAHPRGQRPLAGNAGAEIGDRQARHRPRPRMVFGQMNEPPGARLRVALLGPDDGRVVPRRAGPDTLLFVDNIFRFTQAGSEVSALLGRMPSAVGYQPTLATEMGELQERITSTKKGAITSVQAVYVPADDPTDPAPANTFAAPRRVHLPRALDLREGHLPGRRSARRRTRRILAARSRRRRALPRRPPRAADAPALPRPAGHHRHPRRRRAERRGQADRGPRPHASSGSCRSRSSSPSSSPASRASTCTLDDTIRSFEEMLRRQVGPPARAGVLYVGGDRRGRGRGRRA